MANIGIDWLAKAPGPRLRFRMRLRNLSQFADSRKIALLDERSPVTMLLERLPDTYAHECLNIAG